MVRIVILANIILKFIFLKFMRVQQCTYCECEEYVFEMALWQFLFYAGMYLTSLFFTYSLFLEKKDKSILPAVYFYLINICYEFYLLVTFESPMDKNHIFYALLILVVGLPWIWDILELDIYTQKIKSWFTRKS